MKFSVMFSMLLVLGGLGVLLISNFNATGFQVLAQENVDYQVNLEDAECPIFVEESEKVACPNQQVCDTVCGLKALELSANDEAYNEFGLPSELQANWDGKSCSCTIYYGPSEGEILYHDSKMPINNERYCGENGDANLDADIKEAEKNAEQKSNQRYTNADSVEKKAKIVNDILNQRACDGNAACKEYCKYELLQCKIGERADLLGRPFPGYPPNNCESYNKARPNYNQKDASCGCEFLSEESVYAIQPTYITPKTANFICDGLTIEDENKKLCGAEEICEYACIEMFYTERTKPLPPDVIRYEEYEYNLDQNECTCILSETRPSIIGAPLKGNMYKYIPLKKIKEIAANKDLCAQLRNHAPRLLDLLQETSSN